MATYTSDYTKIGSIPIPPHEIIESKRIYYFTSPYLALTGGDRKLTIENITEVAECEDGSHEIACIQGDRLHGIIVHPGFLRCEVFSVEKTGGK